MPDPVVIVGAGLSGLTCARELQTQGVEVVLFEASDGVGGRVRTDEFDGFLLDRGFQVLLTAYPEAARQLNYEALRLEAFTPGSLIQTANGMHCVADPWRQPGRLLKTALAPIGGLADKIRIGRLRRRACSGPMESVFDHPDQTTESELRRLGFSDAMIERFLRPFLGGVFLDRELQTSCRMMYFVFRMFTKGDTALPSLGMGKISEQLAADLAPETVRLNQSVSEVAADRVVLQSGEVIPYSRLVVATEQPSAAKLLPELTTSATPRSVRCIYYSAPEPPVKERMLILNGTGTGLVNNLCVPSEISSAYAPDGRSLISASVLTDQEVDETLHLAVSDELRNWFGPAVDSWSHIRSYDIHYALPNQTPPALNPPALPEKLRDQIYVCGDYRTNGSINGALESGRRVAEAITAEL